MCVWRRRSRKGRLQIGNGFPCNRVWVRVCLQMFRSGCSIGISEGFRCLIILFVILSCPGAFLVLSLSVVFYISLVVIASLCVR